MKHQIRNLSDTAVMTKRCLLLSKRNPDTFFASILLPALMMLLFVSLFGNLITVEGTSYANYIVPGILLQCIGQCSSTTAIMLNKDMASGIIRRFCTLPVRNSSVLNGHILEAFVRNLVTSSVVLLVAVPAGFRPSASLTGWCVVFFLLAGTILAMSWLAILTGVAANSAEGASALSSLAIVLPYLSSGFVPAETLPAILQPFAKYQPMTPIIDTMRNALLGKPLEMHTFLPAVSWCAVLTALFCAASLVLFRKRLKRE